MAQNLRQIKNRIRSIENTKKVTAAMEMISVAKLNRIDDRLFTARPYFAKLQALLNNLLAETKDISHPLLKERQAKERTTLCIITSDSGLCGLYNNNVIRISENFMRNFDRKKLDLVLVGRRGLNYFRKYGFNILKSYVGFNGNFSVNNADEVAGFLKARFINGQADEVFVAYTYFENALTHKPRVQKMLNIFPSLEVRPVNYIVEPGINEILEELMPEYVSMMMRLMLLEAFTSEHAARTVSMKMATENAKELLQGLVLQRNKLRQANITQDIMEIISSAEALKG